MQTVVRRVIRMSDCADQAVQELNADCGTGYHVESVGQHVNVTVIIIIIISSRALRAHKAVK